MCQNTVHLITICKPTNQIGQKNGPVKKEGKILRPGGPLHDTSFTGRKINMI